MGNDKLPPKVMRRSGAWAVIGCVCACAGFYVGCGLAILYGG